MGDAILGVCWHGILRSEELLPLCAFRGKLQASVGRDFLGVDVVCFVGVGGGAGRGRGLTEARDQMPEIRDQRFRWFELRSNAAHSY